MQSDAQKKHVNMFWGGDNKQVWEDWLKEKGLIKSDDETGDERQASNNGWTDPNDDLSDIEDSDDGWLVGGVKRPGDKDSEEYSSEEAMEDEWGSDDDDDDHGGQMMPIPSL